MARDFSKQFYKSAAWQKARSYALMRDKYRCTKCGSVDHLEVHHIVPLNEDTIQQPYYALGADNLMTLCRSCHTALHAHEGKHTEYDDVLPEIRFDANGYPVPVSSGKDEKNHSK